MRFLVDAMLGRLARWLRIMGFDVLFPQPLADDDLVALAHEQERVLLTKDERLLKEKKVDGYLVRSLGWEDQIREVVEEFNLLRQLAPFSRCLECNQILRPMRKEEATDIVPERVANCHDQFTLCPSCRRIYWQGSHVDRMTLRIQRILGNSGYDPET